MYALVHTVEYIIIFFTVYIRGNPIFFITKNGFEINIVLYDTLIRDTLLSIYYTEMDTPLSRCDDYLR